MIFGAWRGAWKTVQTSLAHLAAISATGTSAPHPILVADEKLTYWHLYLPSGMADSAAERVIQDAKAAARVAPLPSPLDAVEAVQIDEDGVFKYVLLEVTLGDDVKRLVRGHVFAEYHDDILQHWRKRLRAELPEATLEVCGGGRIARSGSTIRIYGYSIAFGQADHAVSAAMIEKAFPSAEVSFSNEGY